MSRFRGIQALIDAEEKRRKHTPFEADLLPDPEKERLCRSLLDEFGVTTVSVREPDGELIHRCTLPWHNEQHPSASVNYRKLVYRCLGCDSKGGLLWWIATCRSEDSVDAARWLADQTGTGPDEQSLSALLAFFDAVYARASRSETSLIPKLSPRALEPWRLIHPYLTDPAPDGRSIPEANVVALSVGYNPDMPVRVGDRWVRSHRIVIPHFWRGDLVGWQSRRIVSDGTPKYVSSPDFPKDQTIYCYRPEERAVVVESPMSVVAAYDLGPVEATFGASITDRQARLLAEHPRVTLFLDPDEAGWKATASLGEYLSAYTAVWVVDNPYNADLGDMVKAGHQGLARRLMDEALPLSVWSPPRRLIELPERG